MLIALPIYGTQLLSRGGTGMSSRYVVLLCQTLRSTTSRIAPMSKTRPIDAGDHLALSSNNDCINFESLCDADILGGPLQDSFA